MGRISPVGRTLPTSAVASFIGIATSGLVPALLQQWWVLGCSEIQRICGAGVQWGVCGLARYLINVLYCLENCSSVADLIVYISSFWGLAA